MSDLLDARDVAKQLLIRLPTLRHMAERGEYPQLLHVCRGQYRVRRTDHEAWLAGRWTKAEQEMADFHAARIEASILEDG
jgi:hypothetical protein